MRSKIPLIEQALTGIVQAHHRQLLAMQLAHIDFSTNKLKPSPRLLRASLEGPQCRRIAQRHEDLL